MSVRTLSTDRTVIFLHIGKTGGTTLRKILHRNFRPSEILLVRNTNPHPVRLRREETIDIFARLPEAERARPNLIEGHVIFGLHRLVPRPTTYITLLRDPVKLAVSQYRWVRREPTHWLHEAVVGERMSLEDYLDSGISLEIDNTQTRAISGDTTTPYGQCSEEMLDRAKRNIEEHFAVVGVLERFDESLLLMRRSFGWSRLHYVPANFSSRRGREEVPRPVLHRIREQNRFDSELHRFTVERLRRETAADPNFERDLHWFRLGNEIYRRTWGDLTYTFPRRVAMSVRGEARA